VAKLGNFIHPMLWVPFGKDATNCWSLLPCVYYARGSKS